MTRARWNVVSLAVGLTFLSLAVVSCGGGEIKTQPDREVITGVTVDDSRDGGIGYVGIGHRRGYGSGWRTGYWPGGSIGPRRTSLPPTTYVPINQ